MTLIVAGIVVTATFLRFWGLRWGMEEGALFPDEALWASVGRRFVPLAWSSFRDPGWLYVPQLVYPTLYGYLVGLVTAVVHVVGSPGDGFPSHAEAVLVARAVSAVVSLLGVGLVGLTALRL